MERNPDPLCPRLLVSVRSAWEAREAVAGGCDILDVKEPRRGSLGAAAMSVIQEITQVGTEAGVPVSAALGECVEWLQPMLPLDLGRAGNPPLRFVKLGLAGMSDRDGWSTEWLNLTDSCSRKLNPATRHVAVIYADWQAARAPHPHAILDALFEKASGVLLARQFAGVLIDTFEKSSGRLLDAMSVEALSEIRQRTVESNLFLALAGRLTADSIANLVPLEPDILAVRSAVCRGEDRNASVDREAVLQFRAAMLAHFPAPAGTAGDETRVCAADGAGHA